MRLAASWLVVAMLLFVGVRADAAGKAEAREAFRRGTQYYNLGEYDRALVEFKSAYLDFDDPVFLFNIAQCHRQLGQKKDALMAYRSYLREQPSSPQRPDVEAKITVLEQQLHDEEEASRAPVVAPPPTIEPAPSPALAVTAVPTPAPRPLYKKWWLWTAVVGGVVVVGAVAVGVAVGTAHTHYPSASNLDGTVHF